jgi:hypothetical protein
MKFSELELMDEFNSILNKVTESLEIKDVVKSAKDVELKIGGINSYFFDIALAYKNFEIYIDFKINDNFLNNHWLSRIDWRFFDELSNFNRIFLIFTPSNLILYLNRSLISLDIINSIEPEIKQSEFGSFFISDNKEEVLTLIFSSIKELSTIRLPIKSFDPESLNYELERQLEEMGYQYYFEEEVEYREKIDKIKNVIKEYFSPLIQEYEHEASDNLSINKFEFQFFDVLLPSLNPKTKFYRYGSLQLCFYLAKDKTMTLSGLSGMNDISEINYVESYLELTPTPNQLHSISYLNNLNSKFIMSASTLEDDLNQWRLYGNDSTGVCLELEMKDCNINNFYVKAISYGKRRSNKSSNGEVIHENRHFELDILRAFQNAIYKLYNFTFVFKSFDIWKHFFKSYEYEVEREIRVLYIKTDEDNNAKLDWVLTHSHNILNPVLFFQYQNLPFKINKVLFGSKAPEVNVNIQQFEYLTQSKGINITFSKSQIKNYR